MFFGFACDIKLLIENRNIANNLRKRIPELVEKKDPPIITNIKKINERFSGVSFNETPILEIQLLINNRILLKSFSKFKKIKKTAMRKIK